MNDFLTVTELAADDVTQEQVERLCHRYYWAGKYCQDKDVLEVACGSGQGLGYLAKKAKSLQAGDYSQEILNIAQAHYGQRIQLKQFDAQSLPFGEHSFDVVILFEAIYYLQNVDAFIQECLRILRPQGKILIATANKDLYDFSPSPYSNKYYGTVELAQLFQLYDLQCELFGYLSIQHLSWRQRVLRPLKKLATTLGLLPKTMQGKKLLKKFVFGELVKMPSEVQEGMIDYIEPVPISAEQPDTHHKVLYCVATLP
jgi:ubiquinone/menaquinone biosynthesis C-methylase UbiE